LVVFLVALLLRFWVLPVASGLAFLTFYPAVVFAFYLCGTGPGRTTLALSAAAGYVIFTPPHWSLVPSRESVLSTVVFVLSSLLIGWIIEQLQHKAEALRMTLQRLKRTEDRYRSMLEEQTDVIVRFTADGTVVYVNPAFCRMFGVAQEQVVGSHWRPKVWPDDAPGLQAKLAALSPANPVVTAEVRVAAPDGEYQWRQIVYRASFDEAGALVDIQAVGRDISDRKMLEDRLAVTAAEMSDLYDNAPSGYYSLDGDGRFLRINNTLLGWLG